MCVGGGTIGDVRASMVPSHDNDTRLTIPVCVYQSCNRFLAITEGGSHPAPSCRGREGAGWEVGGS